MAIVLRSVKGSNLTSSEIDGNFTDLDGRVTAIEDDPPTGPYPTSIALAGTSFTMGMSDASVLGPITFTIPMPRWRGDWLPTTAYSALDFFRAPTGELGAVLYDHISESSFNWDLEYDTSGALVYRNISGSAGGALGGLSDVTLDSPSFAQVLQFDGDKWVNSTFSAGSETLAGLSDVSVSSPEHGSILAWDSGDEIWKDYFLGEVSTGGMAAYDVLYWDTGAGDDGAWVNGNAGTYLTPQLQAFQIDSGGSPGVKGLLPASASGDADARKILDAAGAWVPDHDIVVVPSVAGTMSSSQALFYFRVPRACYIPSNFAAQQGYQSRFGGTANATSSTAIKLQKAASASPNSFSDVGTITIGAGSVSPSALSTSSAVVHYAAGDVLRLMGPSSADGTFAGFYGTLVLFGE